MPSARYIWFDGTFVDYNKAMVHVLTHSLQYGTGIFEGVRAYGAKKGTAIFRLDDHVKRFYNSAKIYNMPLRFKPKDFRNAIIETVRRNKLAECYLRPFAFYSNTRLGVNPKGTPTSTIVAAIPMGSYFANKDKGLSCKVVSWRRINSAILPPEAKGSGNYLNSMLASFEANEAGADEAILLSLESYVAEGPGENIFMVQDDKLVTPSKASDILLGITRDSIIKLAENMGLTVEERGVHREELVTSDEIFFCGTAAEITPIVKVDDEKIGNGKPGPITKMVNNAYVKATRGENREFEDWLTYV